MLQSTKDGVSLYCRCGYKHSYSYSDLSVCSGSVSTPKCSFCLKCVMVYPVAPYSDSFISIPIPELKRIVFNQYLHKRSLLYGASIVGDSREDIFEKSSASGFYSLVDDSLDLVEAPLHPLLESAASFFQLTGCPFPSPSVETTKSEHLEDVRARLSL